MRHEISRVSRLRTKFEDYHEDINDIDIPSANTKFLVLLDTAQIQTSSIDLRKSRLIIGGFNFNSKGGVLTKLSHFSSSLVLYGNLIRFK